MDKLSIQNEMMQFDSKNRDFYLGLTDEERKKFSNYLMIRWGSAVQGSADLQAFYLIACNERFNKHFFAINRHPQLQWLSATTVSPGIEVLKENGGMPRHQWIAPKKKDSANSGIKKQLAELFPNLKNDELDVMSAITTKKEIDEYLRKHGQ